MNKEAHYLSAVSGADSSTLEVRTKVFSASNLRDLLRSNPAAVTFGPKGTWTAERLLEVIEHATPARMGYKIPEARPRWRIYEKRREEPSARMRTAVDSRDIEHLLAALDQDRQAWAAIISESMIDLSKRFLEDLELLMAELNTLAKAEPVESLENLDVQNRRALHAARAELLQEIGSYTSEQLATAAESSTSNASQYASDLRTAGKIFGVRFGREWRYPSFQFNAACKPVEPYADVRTLLSALAPDERGWDRLQWFVQPNENLRGQTPREVWPKDRAAVIEAASRERWNGRD